MELGISWSLVRLPRNKKQTYLLNSKPQMWPSDLTLTLNFQGQVWNSLYLGQKWSDCHEINKQTYQLNSKASNVTTGLDLGCDLDLEFSRSNLESAISRPKTVRLPWNKKQTYWTLCLKCDHQIWPSPWPWSWILKVKYGICYISAKNGLIAMKQKVNIWIEP